MTNLEAILLQNVDDTAMRGVLIDQLEEFVADENTDAETIGNWLDDLEMNKTDHNEEDINTIRQTRSVLLGHLDS